MGTWDGDPGNAADRFLAEHGGVSHIEGEDLVMNFGSAGLLPPWPPVIACAVCATPVARHGDAGWRHELGVSERGGCQTPWPEG